MDGGCHQKLWDVAWDLWEQQNGFQHAWEYQEAIHQQAGLDDEIRYQFQKGTADLPHHVHYLFDGNLEDLLHTYLPHRWKWLTTVEGACTMANVQQQSHVDSELAASRKLMYDCWLNGTHHQSSHLPWYRR